MRGEKTALDMQLLELERRMAELELQIGQDEWLLNEWTTEHEMSQLINLFRLTRNKKTALINKDILIQLILINNFFPR